MPNANPFLAPDKLTLKDADASKRLIGSMLEDKAAAKAADKLAILALADKIAERQEVFFASKKHKLLIVVQGMDTSGKDGTVRSVFGAINPLGARAVAFKAPTEIERQHDFLWRIHQQVPGSGEMVIFNRSHYEDVLITKVHKWIDADECERRYAHINDFEALLVESGTIVMKFFLHISKDEQKRRLEERIADPEKHWKFDPQDLVERNSWDQYQRAYELAINATHQATAPWYIIPSDSKTKRNLAIATIVEEKLASLKLSYPEGAPGVGKLVVT